MYLITIVCFVLTLQGAHLDCGCGTNRESDSAQCKINNEKPSDKYTKETNTDQNTENMILIKDGTFLMGTNEPYFIEDKEGPARNVTVKSFYMDKYEVSNENFKKFIDETGYKTEAENFGDSFIFSLLVSKEEREQYVDFRAVQAPWWIKMKEVTWDKPEGKKSNIKGRSFICFKISAVIKK